MPEETFGLDFSKNRIGGSLSGLEAAEQAVRLILSVERYSHIIYSYNYGTELSSLIGQPASLVLPELKRRVTEAVMCDDRVTGTSDFEFETRGNAVSMSFTVNTVYGDVAAGTEIGL